VWVESTENGTLHDDTTSGVDAALSSDQASGEDLVSGTYLDGDTCVVAAGDSFTDARTKGVFNAVDPPLFPRAHDLHSIQHSLSS